MVNKDMQQKVDQAWSRIIQWHKENDTGVSEKLNKPVTQHELDDFKENIDFKLPEAFEYLYLKINGVNSDDTCGLFQHGVTLMSLRSILQVKKTHSEVRVSLRESGDILDVNDYKEMRGFVKDKMMFIKGAVKPDSYSDKWLCISNVSDGESILYIDYDPAPGGVVGQIIKDSPGCGETVVLAPSFEDFLIKYAHDFQAGRYEFDRDWIEPVEEEDSYDWGLPDYLK